MNVSSKPCRRRRCRRWSRRPFHHRCRRRTGNTPPYRRPCDAQHMRVAARAGPDGRRSSRIRCRPRERETGGQEGQGEVRRVLRLRCAEVTSCQETCCKAQLRKKYIPCDHGWSKRCYQRMRTHDLHLSPLTESLQSDPLFDEAPGASFVCRPSPMTSATRPSNSNADRSARVRSPSSVSSHPGRE